MPWRKLLNNRKAKNNMNLLEKASRRERKGKKVWRFNKTSKFSKGLKMSIRKLEKANRSVNMRKRMKWINKKWRQNKSKKKKLFQMRTKIGWSPKTKKRKRSLSKNNSRAPKKQKYNRQGDKFGKSRNLMIVNYKNSKRLHWSNTLEMHQWK